MTWILFFLVPVRLQFNQINLMNQVNPLIFVSQLSKPNPFSLIK